jgi:hypothetical protein
VCLSYVFSPGCYANMRLSSIHVDVDVDIYYMDIWYLHQVVLQGCLEGLHCGLVFDVRWQVVPL